MAWLKNNYQFEFTDTLTTAWMSVRISNEKENGAVAVFTNQYVTVRSEDNSIVERMKGSATGGTLTLTLRWLDQSDTDTEVPALKREWREWSKAFVTYVASQHVDAKNNNIFSWNQTFNDITVTNNSTLTNATVSWKYKWPVVADVTARNVLYPAPVWWNEVFVQSLNAKQVYNAGTAQRETQAVGTPSPDASETVKGIAEIATQAEVDAGTSDTTIVTPLKLKTQQPEALVDKDTYILWEDCLVNDSLFPETTPTFAESTSVQNIWDVTANTRVSILSFGSGVAWSTMQLALRKFVSPSADLAIRLETVDWSWNPTGTLVNANATATVTQASLTTSLKPYLTINSNISDSNGLTKPDTTSGIVWWAWFRIYTKERLEINSVTKNWSSTASRALVKTDIWNTILATATFSWNVATFSSTVILDKNIHYRIEVDNNWWWRTSRDNVFWTPTYPVNLTNINYVWGSSGWWNYSKSPDIETINTSAIQDLTFAWSFTIPLGQRYAIVLNQVGNVVNGTNYYGIGYVARDTTTRRAKLWNGTVWSAEQTNRFYYTSSTLALPTVLSKTNADFTYKLPTDFPRIANEAKSACQNVITTYLWLKGWFTGLSNTTYYASNTPWLISATAGTNPYVVGNGIDATTLKIDWKNLNKAITVSASPFSYTNTTGWPIQVKITGGTVNPIVINGVTTATATWHINTLPAWATMTVTYTVLPTITYSDL